MEQTRLAAGPLGPLSTFHKRRSQKVRSALAILAACREVLSLDSDRPSITNVLAFGGFSESTLHRKRYKPILHAAQMRFDARATGQWHEDDADWFSSLEEMAAAGHWVMPQRPALLADSPEKAAASLDGFEAGTDSAETALSSVQSQIEVENAALLVHVAALEAEVQRRDDQLYHALQTSQLFSRTIRMLRRRVAELNGEILTLQTEPWEPREQGTWRDEHGEEDDWPENQ
jgi:hypothetical protein